MDINEKIQKINDLKIDKNAVIMAHYYVDGVVQEVADYIGDSYYLSHCATQIDKEIIVLCGVKFMGESAKALNPEKKILLPAEDAECPMAHMATVESIRNVRKQYEDVAVVCYVNSTAELKAESDVCVTSANALNIVSKIPNKNIFFIPDKNLATYISEKLPEKNFIFNDGCCYIHDRITQEQVMHASKEHPEAKILVHPECKKEIADLADYIGSTSGIIGFVKESMEKEFIIVTEEGVLYELKKNAPDKLFYTVTNEQICPGMKKVSLDNIIEVLERENSQIEMDIELINGARKPMEKMLELAEK